jgi:hypothetical protein
LWTIDLFVSDNDQDLGSSSLTSIWCSYRGKGHGPDDGVTRTNSRLLIPLDCY